MFTALFRGKAGRLTVYRAVNIFKGAFSSRGSLFLEVKLRLEVRDVWSAGSVGGDGDGFDLKIYPLGA